MSRWFRHYAGMMRDEKLVVVAIRSKQPVERVVWVWGAILESAAEVDDAGRFEVDAAEVSYFLRADEDDIIGIMDALEQSRRIAAGRVVKWGDRQYQSDKSVERQARYRERQREKNSNNNKDVLKCVTVTSRDGEVTPQETETETDNTSSLRSDVCERAKKRDEVSEALEAYSDVAARCGLPAVRVLNDARKRKLTSLLKTHGLPLWLEALAKVEASDFCLGRKGDFRADLDFLLQQQSFTRLLEGRYDNRASAKPAEPPPKHRNIGDAIRDEARRLGVLKDEPDSHDRRIHSESHSAGNVRVLDLAFKPALKGFG